MTQTSELDFTQFFMSIDGKLVQSKDSFSVLNPATEASIAEVPNCSKAQMEEAIGAARAALPKWKALSWETRADKLKQMADIIEGHTEELALCLTREQGKSLHDARLEVGSVSFWLRSIAKRTLPDEFGEGDFGRKYKMTHVPVGVVCAIAPWNFPVSLAIWKCAPALLTGNTVILKPSPYTPLTSLKLGELFIDALPAGVLNVISGGDQLGPMLTEHNGIDKISFTGSTQTGRAVMRSASTNLKRVTLELGGNDAAIVLPDVDVQEIAEPLFWAAFRNAGQICVASKRIYVHDSIYDEMLAQFAQIAERNLPKSGEEDGATIGPVQNRAQYERVKGMIDDLRKSGANLIEPKGDIPKAGYFIAPTLVDNPPDDWPIVREEPFGPVVPILRYSDIDEVVLRANDSEYGLGASVWGKDTEAAAAVAAKLEAGTVWINSRAQTDPGTPFGGLKQSGIGVENGLEGLKEFTNKKVVVL